MSKLADDSVICVYLEMVNKTQSDLKVPEYSEIYLRLALNELCGKHFIPSADVLELYRKLLVLYYCEQYHSLTTVIAIMERCFTREKIYNIIKEKNDLLCKWLEFQNNYVTKDATTEER